MKRIDIVTRLCIFACSTVTSGSLCLSQDHLADLHKAENSRIVSARATQAELNFGEMPDVSKNRRAIISIWHQILITAVVNRELADFLKLTNLELNQIEQLQKKAQLSFAATPSNSNDAVRLSEGLQKYFKDLQVFPSEEVGRKRLNVLAIKLLNSQRGGRLPKFCYPFLVADTLQISTEELKAKTEAFLVRFNKELGASAHRRLDEIVLKLPEISARKYQEIMTPNMPISDLHLLNVVDEKLDLSGIRERICFQLITFNTQIPVEIVADQAAQFDELRTRYVNNPAVKEFLTKVERVDRGEFVEGFDPVASEKVLLEETMSWVSAELNDVLLPHQLRQLEHICLQVLAKNASNPLLYPMALKEHLGLSVEQQASLESLSKTNLKQWNGEFKALEAKYLDALLSDVPSKVFDRMAELNSAVEFDFSVDKLSPGIVLVGH